MDVTEKASPSGKIHEVSEDSKIVIRVKDALAIGAFLVYIGMSIAGYLFAKDKLDSLEHGNQILQEKVDGLENSHHVTDVKLEHIREDLGEIKNKLNESNR
jgi:hypothetical protein